MISRRALFGLSVGAVAAAEPIVVGLDFGTWPAAVFFTEAAS